MKSSDLGRHRRAPLRAIVAAVLLQAGVAQAGVAPLVELVRGKDHAAAVAAIRQGADVDAAAPDGSTPLHWAIYHVDRDLVAMLLDRRANPDARNRFGSTPLAEAVKVADVGITRRLLAAGADPESANEDGQTALMLAARTGVVELVRALVDAGADVNAREGWRGQTALMWAAAEGHAEVVELLVARGADVSARALWTDWGNQVTAEPRAQYRPTGGLTPLLYATKSGCLRCVDTLLAAGADIDLPNPDGVTPLISAIDNLNHDLALHLLERGADPRIQDWYGRTPLYVAADVSSLTGGIAARTGDLTDGIPVNRATAVDVIRALFAAGVEPNPQLNMHRPGRGGNSGRFTDDLLTAGATPLLRAAVSRDVEVMRALLAGGALVDLPNVMGVTPLMAAAGMGVSIRDPRGQYETPDAQDRSIAAIDVLLAAGADVNRRVSDTSGRTARIARPSTMTEREGQTAIFGAINWGWPKVVRHLIDHGARVDIADARGRTALDAVVAPAGGRDFRAVPEVQEIVRRAARRPVAARASATRQ